MTRLIPQTDPTSADNVFFDALSFTVAGQTVTINAAANCLNMDWTGATNTPNLGGGGTISFYGSVTLIAAMGYTHYGYLLKVGGGSANLTTNGRTISSLIELDLGTISLQDTLVSTNSDGFFITTGTLITNNNTVTVTSFNTNFTGTRVITLGSSVINCTSWLLNATNLTLTANTSTINVSGTGVFAGGNIATYNNINLNGTAHTVSGAFTCNILTRNGTATKTDSVTFTSGTTITCTTFAMIGNSSTNRLLVRSLTLGTAAIITTTKWTGTVNVDIMDITATNAVDLSAITGLSGDCCGNIGITFTTTTAQTSASTDTWSTAAKWTSRVPLPQDDVTCSHNTTVDMPRIGRSITFTGTPTISLSNDITNYGSFTLPSGCTYTHNSKGNFFRGRSSYQLITNGKSFFFISGTGPGGTLTFQDDFTATDDYGMYFTNGTFDFNDRTITLKKFYGSGTALRTLNLGNGTITLIHTSAAATYPKWEITTSTNLTFNAEGSTIILTSSAANAQTFAGGGLTYNNVTVSGAGAYALTITGNNAFNVFTVDRSVAAKTIITTGTTQTFTAVSLPPTGATALTITGGTWTKPNSNLVVSDYLVLTNCIATQTKRFYAGTHSTDSGGNTNWIFGNPQPAEKSGNVSQKMMVAGLL